jgi:hypothetical protein
VDVNSTPKKMILGDMLPRYFLIDGGILDGLHNGNFREVLAILGALCYNEGWLHYKSEAGSYLGAPIVSSRFISHR